MPASAEAKPAKVAPPSWEPPSGVPVTAFAVVAVLASTLGRSIFPALFGAATGLATFIDRTQHVASFLTQMVAVGGVAFTLRAVATTFAQRSLGIGYRMLVIPAGTAASALAMAAAGSTLPPDYGCTLVIAALAAAAASSAVAMLAPSTRALGFALFLSAVAGAFDLAGIRVGESAVQNASAAGYKLAGVLMTAGFAFEVLLVSLAFGLLAARSGARVLLLVLVSFLLMFVWGYAIKGSQQPGAPAWEVVTERAVTSWLRAPSPLVPAAARFVLEAAGTVATVAMLVTSRRAPLAALFALCLLARGATDVPLPALLLVVAALAVPASVQSALPRGVSPARGLTPEPTASR